MNRVYYKLKMDRNIPVPLYYQLKQFMISQIEQNVLKEGDPVPSEEELCHILNVSRATIRQAFSELVAEGHLKRMKAKGTFIAKPKIEGEFFQTIESFNDEMRKKGLVPSTKVIGMGVMRNEKIMKTLQLEDDDACIYIKRIRFANDDPMVYVETFLSDKKYHGLLEVDLEKNSLYQTLDERFGVVVNKVSRLLQVDLADKKLATLLNIKEDSPIYYVYTSSFTQEGEPVAHSIAQYRGDRNEFRVDLVRK